MEKVTEKEIVERINKEFDRWWSKGKVWKNEKTRKQIC